MLKEFTQSDLVKQMQKVQVVAIGPFTAEELKKFNAETRIADVHTVPGAFEAMKNIFSLA
jgi:uroporphyrinogen-III synthase